MVCSMFYRGIHYAKYNWLGKVGDGAAGERIKIKALGGIKNDGEKWREK